MSERWTWPSIPILTFQSDFFFLALIWVHISLVHVKWSVNNIRGKRKKDGKTNLICSKHQCSLDGPGSVTEKHWTLSSHLCRHVAFLFCASTGIFNDLCSCIHFPAKVIKEKLWGFRELMSIYCHVQKVSIKIKMQVLSKSLVIDSPNSRYNPGIPLPNCIKIGSDLEIAFIKGWDKKTESITL